MMAWILAELKAEIRANQIKMDVNQAEMKASQAKMDANLWEMKEEMLVKMEANQGKMMANLDAHNKRMIANMDSQWKKNGCLCRKDRGHGFWGKSIRNGVRVGAWEGP